MPLEHLFLLFSLVVKSLSAHGTWLFAITPSHALFTLLHHSHGGPSVSVTVRCVERGTKWVVRNSEYCTQKRLNRGWPARFFFGCCVFRGFAVNYLSSRYPLSLRCDIQVGHVCFWVGRVPECTWMSHHNENGYDSDRAISEQSGGSASFSPRDTPCGRAAHDTHKHAPR